MSCEERERMAEAAQTVTLKSALTTCDDPPDLYVQDTTHVRTGLAHNPCSVELKEERLKRLF